MALLDKLQASRETWVDTGGFSFKLRRPHALALQRMRDDNLISGEVVINVILDWKNVKESDVVPGGGSDPVPFESALWREWISDRPELWSDIMEALTASLTAYTTRLGQAEKN